MEINTWLQIDRDKVHDKVENKDIDRDKVHDKVENEDIDRDKVHDKVENEDIDRDKVHDKVENEDIDSQYSKYIHKYFYISRLSCTKPRKNIIRRRWECICIYM